MKTLAFSMILAIGLAAPAFAQEPPAAPAPAPAPAVDQPYDPDSLDALTHEALAPLDRIKMLAKCGGPPPKPFPVASAPKSEPAVVAESATAATSTGG